MPFINWTDSLSVGIESIDQQHQQLVSIINDLNDAMKQNEADHVMTDIFIRLVNYTKVHFSFEEQLFDSYGYQQSDQHKVQHEALIETVHRLQDKLERGSNRIGIEVMEFLRRWLTDHILKTDMDYAIFLKDKGVK